MSLGGGEREIADDPSDPERLLAGAFLAATCLLRLAYVFRYRIDSDEPQHLHVVWAWTQGLLPYRDVFDNHMPLFQLLCAPLLFAVGPRPDALLVMRIAMLPLFAVALWALHRIARALFGARTALWATVLAGLAPGFFLCSIEFRTDDLWTVLWLLAVAVAIEGPPTPRRCFAVGLLLGTALGVSLKTVLLLLALAAGAAGTLVVADHDPALPRPPLVRCAAAVLAGLVPVPLALTALFAGRGALGPYLYGTVWHNLAPGLGDWSSGPHRWAFFPAALLLLCAAARSIARSAPRPALGAQRALVFLATGVYLVALFTLWPIRSREDYLPFYPLLAMLVTPLVVRLGTLATRRPSGRVLAPASAALVGLAVLAGGGGLWKDKGPAESRLIADVLRLTRPGEPVMDLKGEAVFRPRPFYYALETVTQARFRHGLLEDDIPERLIASATTVAVADVALFPPRARGFLWRNYVTVGPLRVAGHVITRVPASGETLSFALGIPTRYAIVTDGGAAAGRLDGTPYDGPRFLDAGTHEYTPAAGDGRVAVVWATAAAEGFSPFHRGSTPG